ncbi:hypothetical protein Gbem_0515 [Citrifermentans bemidjiense Bem]|uniref:Uncharacterized protein n=1 Tax=Citrifermentans bemidjiense (strain ATCC BAA-1014 / DSM 16622 / JCM 12645 / Bem) TaxID=404380 RepID=B5ECB6_CITBB|nr:DUF5684 domain-containing protein [Citrifermentans bemidjiense]ACH37544.2 hypothetical protein Gbem_0515 [Citrifermentans bemidjiense Bem]
MKTLFRTWVLVLAIWLELSGMCFAKQVFLQDGSVLECEAFWRRNGEVVVKVNRDVVLNFTRSEVNIGKTFKEAKRRAAAVKRSQGHRKRSETTSVAGTPGHQGVQSAARAGEAQAAVLPAEQVPAAPKAAPVAASAPVATEAVLPEPAQGASAESGPISQTELEQRTRENAELMAQAIKKQDPELMKKAVEAQKSLVQQQKSAQTIVRKNGQPLKEPAWFKYLLMMAFSGVLIIVAMWVIFRKAGESGIKSIIPFYNLYVLMVISGKPGWWFILLFVPIVGLAIHLLTMLSLAEKFGRSAAFAVGMIFLPVFFFPMLAFGGSQYEAMPKELEFTFSEEPPVS